MVQRRQELKDIAYTKLLEGYKVVIETPATAGDKTGEAVPAAYAATGLIGLKLLLSIDLPWLRIVSFLTLAILVAVNPKLHSKAVGLLSGLFGVIHGLFNGSALAAIGAGPMALAGIAVTVFVIALLVSAFVVSLRVAWTRNAVRVAGQLGRRNRNADVWMDSQGAGVRSRGGEGMATGLFYSYPPLSPLLGGCWGPET